MIVKKKGILLWQPNTNLELDHPLVRSVNFRFLAIIASYSHRLHKQHDWVGGCMIQSFYTNQFISSACFLTLCFHTCGCVSKTLQEMRKLSRSLSDCYITKLLLMSLSFSLSLSGCGFRFWIQNEGRATEIPQTLWRIGGGRRDCVSDSGDERGQDHHQAAAWIFTIPALHYNFNYDSTLATSSW